MSGVKPLFINDLGSSSLVTFRQGSSRLSRHSHAWARQAYVFLMRYAPFMPPTAKFKARKLTDLSPTEFENLVFDLLISRGMVNVVWRTPGPDGGRDIEAFTVQTDFSGAQSVSRWFIECKKYVGSLDWPTIYGKLAYADSMQAEYLLLCTTSKFTPAAISNVDLWNSSRRKLKIRLWPGQELEVQLKQHPDLRLKYGLSASLQTPGYSLVSLSLALSKSVASVYSELVFAEAKLSPMLQAAQAFSELLQRRMEDMNEGGRIRPLLSTVEKQLLDGCSIQGVCKGIDEVGLRAFVAYLIALTREPVDIIAKREGECALVAKNDIFDLLHRYRDPFSAIALWSDFEFTFDKNTIYLKQRP